MIIFFFYGLFFFGFGLAALPRFRQEGEFPFNKQLAWMEVFGFATWTVGWIEMLLASGEQSDLGQASSILRILFQPVSGLLLLRFGWGILKNVSPLSSWTFFLPGIMIIPIATIIMYTAANFVTPSPKEIPINFWSRQLLNLHGSRLSFVELKIHGVEYMAYLMWSNFIYGCIPLSCEVELQ